MAEEEPMRTCEKCKKTMRENQFYTYKNGEKTEFCKKCLTMHVDNFDPSTFLWLLKKLDVPYVEEEWNTLRDRAFAKDPRKMNGMSVFGKYLSKMKLRQWKDYSWEDTEMLAEKALGPISTEPPSTEELLRDTELKQLLDNGEISEAEFKTLATVDVQKQMLDEEPPPSREEVIGEDNDFKEEDYLPEDELEDLGAELTQEDKIYLATKWGRFYKPNEWVLLERKYNEMMQSFDIHDSDTDGTLILICKTFLKLNAAIDIGDMDTYQKLSRVYDSLRKSAKFTAVQNKNLDGTNSMSAVGELVAYCEQCGGRIPKYEIKVDYDIVDKVIRDMKSYTKSLIYEDTALAHQIEEYIKKRETADKMKKDREEAKAKGLDNVELSDDDYAEHYEMLQKAKQQDEEIYYNDTKGAD